MKYMGLSAGKKDYKIYGASFYNAPIGKQWHTVKMAAEIDAPCTVSIPTPDFDTPPEAVMNYGLKRTIIAMVKNKKIFVGCMAGRGRTGLFMACLARVVLESERQKDNPVKFVRDNYYSHAVETKEQEDYVTNLDIYKLIKLFKVLNTSWVLKKLPESWILAIVG